MTGGDSVVVLGIGNPLVGDDGVGEALARALAEEGLPEGARVRLAGGDPLALLEELEAGRRVLLIDACRAGARPGAVTYLRLDDPEWPARAAPWSLHGLDLPCAFRLAAALGLPCREGWVMGIEPAGTAPGGGLSPEIQEAWPRLMAGARKATLDLLSGAAPGGVPG